MLHGEDPPFPLLSLRWGIPSLLPVFMLSLHPIVLAEMLKSLPVFFVGEGDMPHPVLSRVFCRLIYLKYTTPNSA